MWLMLQQDKPDDYVIATGHTYALSEFIDVVFSSLKLDWRKRVRTDPELLRPTEIMVSKANPLKAHRVLGWKARFTMPDVAVMMVKAYMEKMKRG